MKLVTWNVNSIRARLPRVLELLAAHQPDVLCLQETKVDDAGFPADELAAAGYRAAIHGEGRWNGVAIVAPASVAIANVQRGLDGEPNPQEARWLEATVDGVRVASVYVPNGREPHHPMYAEKLVFLSAMRERLEVLATESAVVAGDFNIAPDDRDVWDIRAFDGATHVTEPERDRLKQLLDAGFVDAYRQVEPHQQCFTWWDYRMGAFRRDMGMRIDLALVQQNLRVDAVDVDTVFRRNNEAGDKPSDHAPVIVTIARHAE
ncbi:MAG: exodeoxyribonuclease III [Nitriliruptoraceae bacterium]